MVVVCLVVVLLFFFCDTQTVVRFWRNFVGEKLLMEGGKIEVFLLFFYSLDGLLIIADAVDWKEDSEIR